MSKSFYFIVDEVWKDRKVKTVLLSKFAILCVENYPKKAGFLR